MFTQAITGSPQEMQEFKLQGHTMRKCTVRPHTTMGHRYTSVPEGLEVDDVTSDGGTFTVEGKSERQTRVKLESLERRLRSNEKARKEVEGELEQMKATNQKFEREVPSLRKDLAEATSHLADCRMQIEELEQKLRFKESLVVEVSQREESLSNDFKQLMVQILTYSAGSGEDLKDVDKSTSGLIKMIKSNQMAMMQQQADFKELQEMVDQLQNQLSRSRDHVTKLLAEIEALRTEENSTLKIERKELEITNETSVILKNNLDKMECTANKFYLEIDMLKSELRFNKNRVKDLEQELKSAGISIRSLETEKSAFLETLSIILRSETPLGECEIKQTLREVMLHMDQLERDNNKFELERHNLETKLVDQAKHLRNALFRARTAEDESAVFMEKSQNFQEEIGAADVERMEMEKKLREYEEAIGYLADILNVSTSPVIDDVTKRVAHLVNCEQLYQKIFEGNGKDIEVDLLIEFLRKSGGGGAGLVAGGTLDAVKSGHQALQTLRKKMSALDTITTKKVIDKLDKQLLTKMTLDTIKTTDTEKFLLKKKLSEQDKRIRHLEKDKRENEKLRSIVRKWEKKSDKE